MRRGIGLELELVDDFVTHLELKEKEKIDKYLARELRKLSKLSTIAPSTKFTPTRSFFLPNSSFELRNPD